MKISNEKPLSEVQEEKQKEKELPFTVNEIQAENSNLLLTIAMQDSRVNDLENENANIILEVATTKGGI